MLYALGAITLTFLICGICSFPVIYIYRYYIKPEIDASDTENDSYGTEIKKKAAEQSPKLESKPSSITFNNKIHKINSAEFESASSTESINLIHKKPVFVKPILKQSSSKIVQINPSKERHNERVLVIPEATVHRVKR